MSKQAKAAVVVLAAVFFLGVLLTLHFWEKNSGQVQNAGEMITSSPNEEQTFFNEKWYTKRKGLQTVLLIGVDKAAVNKALKGHGEFEQSDFLMLLVLDTERKQCTALHIDRDTMADVNVYTTDTKRLLGIEYQQLAFAHAYRGGKEGCADTAEAVSRLLYETKIDHYISLYFDGIPVLNDLVGGVSVQVPADLAAIDSSFTEGETVTLHGDRALAFVRSRDTSDDESNALRMVRHRIFLEALQEKLRESEAGDEGFVMSALLELNDYLVSDCTVEQLSAIARQLSSYGPVQYLTPAGERKPEGNYIAFYPDEARLRGTVMELFYQPAE